MFGVIKKITNGFVKAPCHSDAATARVLQQASEGVEAREEVCDILGESGKQHGGISRVHLHHPRIVLPYGS